MKLIILDLDSTLLFTDDDIENECGGRYTLEFEDDTMTGVWRNHYKEFLIEISKHFDIAIWSAGSVDYVLKIADLIKKIIDVKFVMTRDDCEDLINPEGHSSSLQKPLCKIFNTKPQYYYHNTVIIDDNDHVAYNNPINHIKVEPFEGEDDDELILLKDNLIKNKDIIDIFDIRL